MTFRLALAQLDLHATGQTLLGAEAPNIHFNLKVCFRTYLLILYLICTNIFVLKHGLGACTCFLTSNMQSREHGTKQIWTTNLLTFQTQPSPNRLNNQGFTVIHGFWYTAENHSTFGKLIKAFNTHPVIFMPHFQNNMLHLLSNTSYVRFTKENYGKECTSQRRLQTSQQELVFSTCTKFYTW